MEKGGVENIGINLKLLGGAQSPWLTLSLSLPTSATPSPHTGVRSSTLSAVGTTGGVRMLGGDSGRFLCFCLRRSLSFRLWGGRSNQIWVVGDCLVEDQHGMCMQAVALSWGWALWASSPLLDRLGDLGWTRMAQAGCFGSQRPLPLIFSAY